MKTTQHPNKVKSNSSEGEAKPLGMDQVNEWLKSLDDWRFIPEKNLIRAEYKAKSFLSAVYFIREVAQLAEELGHHPDIHLTGYKYLSFDLSTHAVNGLTINDFILAKQISHKFAEYSTPVQKLEKHRETILNYEISKPSS